MASQKTLPSEQSVEAFITAVPDDARREDALKLSGLLTEWTGEPPVMWGTSIDLEMLHRLVDRPVRVHRGADRRASAGA